MTTTRWTSPKSIAGSSPSFSDTGPAAAPSSTSAPAPHESPSNFAASSLLSAVDLADHMLATARRNIAAAGLTERITLRTADAKQLPFPEGHFSAVICNGSVHHIPDPLLCFAELHRVCALGGMIFVRDLLRPADVSALDELVKKHADGANDHQRAMFDASLRASLTLAEVREMVGRLGYGLETVQQTSDRHWTWAATRA